MSFSSLIFVLAFLPAAVLGYYLLALSPLHRLRLPFLIAMGLFFYGRAQPTYLPLLLASIAANYLLAVIIARNVTPDGSRDKTKGAWLTLGVTANTVMLLGFKYLSAVVASVFGFLGHTSPIGHIIAPLAISFYTFQQISFLIDTARGKVVPQGLIRYLSFIAFFPTLLAGPITLYSEMGPQLAVRPQRDRLPQNLLIGALLFTLGLFKKTVLADTIALWVDPIFTAVHHGSHPGFFLGWSAAIAYTLQIYFDFSGYCDMALGAARMLGIVLPLNFFSPLRSTSIADLWRRWHMTLGRFVRTYIHQPMMIPLARLAADKGLSKWPAMTVSLFVPTFLSMLIIGTWHGPSWTYVLFGTMHGTFMCINELYNALTRKRRKKKKDSQAALFTYGLLTVLAFVCAEVPFRADTVPDALHIFAAMIGLQGLGITHDWHAFLAPTGNGLLLPFMILGSLIVFLLPNTEQILDRIHPALEWEKWRTVDRPRISLTLRFTPAWIAVFSLILFLGFAFISRGTTSFIYFQF